MAEDESEHDGRIIESADRMAGATEIDRTAILLMRAWGEADPRSTVARYPASFIATFADMARAVVADRRPSPATVEAVASALREAGVEVGYVGGEKFREHVARHLVSRFFPESSPRTPKNPGSQPPKRKRAGAL